MELIPKTSRWYRRLEKLNSIVLTFFSGYNKNLVGTYWFDRVTNFGDLLSPLLLKKYGLVPFRVHYKGQAQLICVGSVLDDLPQDYNGFILGSGLINDTARPFSQARILAVRGELTRQRTGAPASTILGDPGLLAEKLLAARQPKQYRVGIVPHYVDKDDPRVEMLRARLQNDLLVIDVQRGPAAVFADIDRCEYILSSSLHGLISADAFGIPNAWLVLSGKLRGNDFKFHDYYSAFGGQARPCRPTGEESLADLIAMTHPVSGEIGAVKQNLDRAFQQLKQALLSRRA